MATKIILENCGPVQLLFPSHFIPILDKIKSEKQYKSYSKIKMANSKNPSAADDENVEYQVIGLF
jgi:hypothetical protein